MARSGVVVETMPVDSNGLLTAEAVAASLDDQTVLVSIMTANNEVGTIFPVLEIATCCDERNVIFHTDASQAVGKIPIDMSNSHIDMLSLSGHKIYAPKGIGALIFRSSPKLRKLNPQMDGGGHERGFRSGTLNVPSIVGLGMACEIAREQLEEDHRRIMAMRGRFESLLMQRIPEISINAGGAKRMPHISNVAFLGVSAESLLIALDGIAASSGSACTSQSFKPSHVLQAMNIPEQVQLGSVRFSFGRPTTLADVDQAVEEIVEKVGALRDLSSPI